MISFEYENFIFIDIIKIFTIDNGKSDDEGMALALISANLCFQVFRVYDLGGEPVR